MAKDKNTGLPVRLPRVCPECGADRLRSRLLDIQAYNLENVRRAANQIDEWLEELLE